MAHKTTRAIKAKKRSEEPQPLEMANTNVIRLDLACGQRLREGYEGVDLFAEEATIVRGDGSAQGTSKVKHKFDLLKYPWPLESNSITELNCSHFIEHIPAIYVDATGTEVPMGTPGCCDALMRFFEEAHRVLVDDGWFHVQVPSAKSNRGFQDPTHRRFIVPEFFAYLWREWRQNEKIDHYFGTTNFVGRLVTSCDPAINAMVPEVSGRKFNSEWNAAVDYYVDLQKKP